MSISHRARRAWMNVCLVPSANFWKLNECVFSTLGEFLEVEKWRILRSKAFASNCVSNWKKTFTETFQIFDTETLNAAEINPVVVKTVPFSPSQCHLAITSHLELTYTENSWTHVKICVFLSLCGKFYYKEHVRACRPCFTCCQRCCSGSASPCSASDELQRCQR